MRLIFAPFKSDPDLVSSSIYKDFDKATEKLSSLFSQRENLNVALEEVVANSSTISNPEALLSAIQAKNEDSGDVRMRLRTEIRRRVEKIGINFSKTGSATATIVFANGARKAVIFKGDSITLAQQVSFERPEIVPRLTSKLW